MPSSKVRRALNFRLSPQPIFDEAAVLEVFDEFNVKPVHIKTLYRHLLRVQGASLDNLEQTDIPQRLHKPLQERFAILTSKVVEANHSKDGSVTKLLIELQDGLRVESVVIRHGATTARKAAGESRTTLCVSSQIGCKMGCTFCATGTMGEIGNMNAGEILEQLVHARRYADIRNIVFMGMGEPLNNYSNVVPAVQAMIDPGRFQLSTSRVTVSTVGIVPKMYQFINDLPNVHLALSLHAPTQDMRAEFVPAAKGYSIEKLMEVSDAYMETGRTLLVEYVLLKGVNDSEEAAHQLGKLLQGRDVTLNLIPYNSTDVDAKYTCPSTEDVIRFQSITVDEYKVKTFTRRTMGDDIAGACGQLVVAKEKQALKDIEDIVPGSKAGAVAGPGPTELDCLWPDVSLIKTHTYKKKLGKIPLGKTAMNGKRKQGISAKGSFEFALTRKMVVGILLGALVAVLLAIPRLS